MWLDGSGHRETTPSIASTESVVFACQVIHLNTPRTSIQRNTLTVVLGIIAATDCDIQKVILKVNSGQANYLRDLPMHESQRETERTADYSIFEYHLRPTFDFQQEILWNGEDVEVLEPLWLRREIAGKIMRMWNKYNKEELV